VVSKESSSWNILEGLLGAILLAGPDTEVSQIQNLYPQGLSSLVKDKAISKQPSQ
jgi:hypothetical protein